VWYAISLLCICEMYSYGDNKEKQRERSRSRESKRRGEKKGRRTQNTLLFTESLKIRTKVIPGCGSLCANVLFREVIVTKIFVQPLLGLLSRPTRVVGPLKAECHVFLCHSSVRVPIPKMHRRWMRPFFRYPRSSYGLIFVTVPRWAVQHEWPKSHTT
jgi:hypothetical protein